MDIFRKIIEFKADKLNLRKNTLTYRIDDCDLPELAGILYATFDDSQPNINRGFIDLFNETKDIFFLKQLISLYPLMIFDVDIVLDKPFYNKTFNY